MSVRGLPSENLPLFIGKKFKDVRSMLEGKGWTVYFGHGFDLEDFDGVSSFRHRGLPMNMIVLHSRAYQSYGQSTYITEPYPDDPIFYAKFVRIHQTKFDKLAPILASTAVGAGFAAGGFNYVLPTARAVTDGKITGQEILNVAKSFASTTSSVEAPSMSFDFSFDSFDSHSFADGAALSAVSDAQNVDFGFTGNMYGDFSLSGESAIEGNFGSFFNYDELSQPAFDFNSLGESPVSNFGTVPGTAGYESIYSNEGRNYPTLSDTANSPINLSRISNSVIGVTKAGLSVYGAAQALKGPPQATPPTRALQSTKSSTAMQNERAQPRSYSGQLASNPSIIGGFGMSTILFVVGGLALAYAATR